MKNDHQRHNRTRALLKLFKLNNRGQTLVEYVLIIVVISLVAITVMKVFQGSVTSTYTNAATSVAHPP